MGIVDRFLVEGSTPTAVNIFVRDRRLVQLKFAASGTESGRNAFQPKAIVFGRRRSAYPQPHWGSGNRDRDSGCNEPGLEIGSRAARRSGELVRHI